MGMQVNVSPQNDICLALNFVVAVHPRGGLWHSLCFAGSIVRGDRGTEFSNHTVTNCLLRAKGGTGS